jgi:transposase-like protein
MRMPLPLSRPKAISSKGYYGNRKNRKDGSDYIGKESKMRVDRYLQTQEAIRHIIKKNAQMEAKLTLPTKNAKWEEKREFIPNKINQLEEQPVLPK